MKISRGNIARGVCFSALLSQTCFAEFVGPPAGAAGVVEKEIQREYSEVDISPEKDIPILEVDVPQKLLNIPDGLSVFIQKIEVEGNESLSQKEIQKIVSCYEGRELSGKEVKDLCLALQKTYVDAGFIFTRVYPPVQDIRDDTLFIQVVQGTLGHIEIKGNRFYKEKYIRKYFTSFLNAPINYNEVMRSLLLLNENSDLHVGAVFRKGSEFGEVDLSLVVKDQRPVHIYTDYNTWGSNVTTYGRLGAKVKGGNLATNGDMLSLVGVVGVPPKDLYYVNTAYSAPINANGMSFDISYLYSHFDVQQLKSLDLEGQSQIAGGRVRQALSRSRKFSSDVFVAFDYKQLKNEVLGQTGSFDRLRVLEVGGKVEYFDSVKGRNIFNATCSAGIPYFLGGSSPIDPQASRPGSGGRFFILNADYTRVQPIPADCYILFSASAQGTFNKLPLPEQIYIGGMGTVRGYPLAAALGDNGYYGTLELHAPLPFVGSKYCKSMKKPWKEIFQLVGFCDHGGVYTNSDVSSEASPTYLTSIGAGARFYGPWNLNISFDAGFPLTDQDKLFNNILYVQVTLGLL